MSEASSSKKRAKRVPFPQRLFHLLKLVEQNGWEDIISWVDDGTGFKVHDREKFEKLLLVKYFNTTRYASFTRQLHAYDFDCIRTGRQTGIYSHPGFTRDNPEGSCSLKREASKLNSKEAISSSVTKKKKETAAKFANLNQGIRAGDTIVRFPSLLRPNIHDDDSSLSSHSDSGSTHQSSMMNGLYNTVCNQVADRTRQALIRIPSEASDNPFQNPDNAFWSLSATHMRKISDASSPLTVAGSSGSMPQQFQQSPAITSIKNTSMNTANMANVNNFSMAAQSNVGGFSKNFNNFNGISDDIFDPIPLEEDEEDEDAMQFGDLEPIPWSPEHSSPDDENDDQGVLSTTMGLSNQLDSILEPRPIQSMIQNPSAANEWWYDSAPMFGTPRKRAALEFSLPVSLPVGFYFMDVSKFGLYWAIFMIFGHFVECLFTAWGGSDDRKDKTYTKDFNIVKPAIGMLQHHVMDLLWFHALLSNMMLTPKLFGPPCYKLLYLFMWPQPINLAVVIKTHYCESKLEGSYAHEKYWLGDIIKKSIAGYALTMIGVIVMHLFEMNYLRVPLVFGFNMIPLWAFESYRYMLSIAAVKGGVPLGKKKVA